MDTDIVVQYLTRGLTLLAVSLIGGVVAVWLTGRLCRRAGLSSGVTALAQILTPVALLCGASLYLDVAGSIADARVMSTEERIGYGGRRPGAWRRSFWARVSFSAAEGPRETLLWTDAPTYDALAPGAAIRIRYLPWLPLVARPAGESTLAFVPWGLVTIGAGVLALVLLLRRLWRRHAALATFAAAVSVIGAVVWWVFPSPWEAPLEPPVLTTTAEVTHVRTETEAFVSGRHETIPAPQPWQLVELRFTPAGRARPVAAIDSVDVGSAPGLERGARLPIRYSANNPREARLIVGARTWRQREWDALLGYVLTLVAIVGVLLLLAKTVLPGRQPR